jgi:hypothetical protein
MDGAFLPSSVVVDQFNVKGVVLALARITGHSANGVSRLR